MAIKIICQNKKARFNYEIMETLEVGVVLTGTEVKSIRNGQMSINESFVIMRNGEMFLLNTNIPLYNHGNKHNHEPFRTRKLLAHAHELRRLVGVTKEKGMTMMPMKVYWKNGKVKVEVGLGKGKKLHDKRRDQKDADWNREKGRILKQN